MTEILIIIAAGAALTGLMTILFPAEESTGIKTISVEEYRMSKEKV